MTLEEIATASIEAAEAGAASVHIDVRDSETSKPGIVLDLYRKVIDRIRSSATEVVINLTTGPGARFVPGFDAYNTFAEGVQRAPPAEARRILGFGAP